MSKQLTPEELSQAKDLNQRYARVYSELGQIETRLNQNEEEHSALLEEKKNLLSDHKTVTQEEIRLASVLTEKYGVGMLDLETGVISIT